jgi:hypothetical protein
LVPDVTAATHQEFEELYLATRRTRRSDATACGCTLKPWRIHQVLFSIEGAIDHSLAPKRGMA